MGKKTKEQKVPARFGKGKGIWIAGLMVLLAVAWFAWEKIGTTDFNSVSGGDPVATSSYVRREAGTPLSPALFVGKTAAAYQVAHEIPDVLDQLYCYCECDRHMGHATLLSCFVDSHAAT